MTEPIRVERGAGIISIFLNRPERRNALSFTLLARLSEALSSEIEEDTAALIISGSTQFFSAGADLADMTGTVDDLRMEDAIEDVTQKIQDAPVPVIAAIDGPCMGGSCQLALSCDYRVASASAFFQVPSSRFGMLYSPEAIVRMHQRIGHDGVFRMLVLGERLDATAALHAGIVSRIVDGASYEAAIKIAEACKVNFRSAMESTKQFLNAIEVGNYDPEEWQERRRVLLSSEERKLAVRKEKKRRGS
jgi:enoyl-CoA hydratase/carnithine racemase